MKSDKLDFDDLLSKLKDGPKKGPQRTKAVMREISSHAKAMLFGALVVFLVPPLTTLLACLVVTLAAVVLALGVGITLVGVAAMAAAVLIGPFDMLAATITGYRRVGKTLIDADTDVNA